MYVLDTTTTRLEDHPLTLVICLEQPESINQLFLKSEGPIRRTREGRSEWEPIKILLEIDGNSN
jgi:hypothetical protein